MLLKYTRLGYNKPKKTIKVKELLITERHSTRVIISKKPGHSIRDRISQRINEILYLLKYKKVYLIKANKHNPQL